MLDGDGVTDGADEPEATDDETAEDPSRDGYKWKPAEPQLVFRPTADGLRLVT